MDENSWIETIAACQDLKTLEQVRLNLLGKQGLVTQAMKSLGSLELEERKRQGARLNEQQRDITQRLTVKRHELESQALNQRLQDEKIDVTLPFAPELKGRIHPLSQILNEIINIFSEMGFALSDGPHIEEEFYNFDALNIPPEHPARQDHDTFYMPALEDGLKKVLRTQTSNVQIRTMLAHKPPLQVISAGRTFRSDYDQTHTPNFHQLEGFMVAEDIHMGHLRHCLTQFCRRIFNLETLPVRFRPAYFPFTEPSAEIDIGYGRRDGQLILGESDDWLEILGCGMIHPNVLRNCDIDPTRYQGFAFGMGIERIAMLKYGISDLRSFYTTDHRWLQAHGFANAHGLASGVGQ